MNLAEKMNQNSVNVAAKHSEVVDEIIDFFKERLNGPKYEQTIESWCSEKDSALKRSRELCVEFWSYHDGCSSTHFRTSGITWENPEHPNGYESNYYKNIDLRDIQREVGSKLLNLVINKLQEFGFSVRSESDESWLKYYKQKLTIKW